MDVHQALQQALNGLMVPLDDYTTGGELEEDHLGLDIVLQTGDKKAPGGSAIPSWVLFESPMGSRTPGKPSFESYSAFTGCVT